MLTLVPNENFIKAPKENFHVSICLSLFLYDNPVGDETRLSGLSWLKGQVVWAQPVVSGLKVIVNHFVCCAPALHMSYLPRHFLGQAGPLAASPATESNSKGIMTYLSPDENKAASEKTNKPKLLSPAPELSLLLFSVMCCVKTVCSIRFTKPLSVVVCTQVILSYCKCSLDSILFY